MMETRNKVFEGPTQEKPFVFNLKYEIVLITIQIFSKL